MLVSAALQLGRRQSRTHLRLQTSLMQRFVIPRAMWPVLHSMEDASVNNLPLAKSHSVQVWTLVLHTSHRFAHDRSVTVTERAWKAPSH